MRLIGYNWEASYVVLNTSWTGPPKLYATESEGYKWQEGARVTGESIVKAIEPRIDAEHVLEKIGAARKSSATGMKIELESKFAWPMV